VITFGDGRVATIYDYYSDETPREPYRWHIGGRGNDDVVEYIRIALGLGQDAISEGEDDELFSDPGRFGLQSRGKMIKFGANDVMILVAPDDEILAELPADRAQLDRLHRRAKAEAQSYLQAGYDLDDKLTVDAVDGNWEYPINLETWTLAELAALDEDQDDDLFAPRLDNNALSRYYEEIYYSIEQLLLQIIPDGDPVDAVQPYLSMNNISIETMEKALEAIGGYSDLYQMYYALVDLYHAENDIDLDEYGMGSFQESAMTLSTKMTARKNPQKPKQINLS
jgi:hypothetical protein